MSGGDPGSIQEDCVAQRGKPQTKTETTEDTKEHKGKTKYGPFFCLRVPLCPLWLRDLVVFPEIVVGRKEFEVQPPRLCFRLLKEENTGEGACAPTSI
jgi:hypothetical protein